jgi:hypothetical protein
MVQDLTNAALGAEQLGIIVEAAATVVLAFFAAVQLWREHRQKAEKRMAAQARISALAFLARRQLRSWLGAGPGSPGDFESWIRDSENASSLQRHLDVAEARFVELLELAADLRASAAASVRSAAVYFFAGAGRLNNYVNTPRPESALDVSDWVKLRNDAWKDLRDCVRLLDDKVGASILLQESRDLDSRRDTEDPPMGVLIARVADELARLDEHRSRE